LLNTAVWAIGLLAKITSLLWQIQRNLVRMKSIAAFWKIEMMTTILVCPSLLNVTQSTPLKRWETFHFSSNFDINLDMKSNHFIVENRLPNAWSWLQFVQKLNSLLAFYLKTSPENGWTQPTSMQMYPSIQPTLLSCGILVISSFSKIIALFKWSIFSDVSRWRKAIYICKEARDSRYMMARLTIDGW